MDSKLDIDRVEKEFKLLYHTKNHQNLGQHNCGILFIDDYVIKGVTIVKSLDPISEDEDFNFSNIVNNELEGYFPKYFSWPGNSRSIYHYVPISENEKAKCFIMERLDGDLTNYMFETSYKNAYGIIDDNYQYMYERFKKTMMNYLPSDNKSISLVEGITKYISQLINELEPMVIKLHHELIKKGWKYYDLKFDNIGYKINNGKLSLYFIDAESGLRKYNENGNFVNKYTSWKDYFLNNHCWSKPLYNYSIFGQYSLNMLDIGTSNFKSDFNEKTSIISYMKIKGCIMEESSESEYGDTFRWIKFRYSNRNDFFVIQKVINKFRLVTFDDYGRHLSNNLYNTYFPQIDKLFDSLNDLYNMYFLNMDIFN